MAALDSVLVVSALASAAAFVSSVLNQEWSWSPRGHGGVVVAVSSPVLQELEAPYRRLAAAVEKAGVVMALNTQSCATKDVVGLYTSGSRRMALCTDQIRRISSERGAYRSLLQATLAHEATHAAQFCRLERRGGPPSVDIAAAKLYALPANQRHDLSRALAIGMSDLPRSVAWRQEAEAFYLEDKPDQVVRMLARYC